MAGSIPKDMNIVPPAASRPSGLRRIFHFRRHPDAFSLKYQGAAEGGGYSNNLVGHGS